MKHLIEHDFATKTYCGIQAPEEIATLDDLYGPEWERIKITDIECQVCQDKYHEIGKEINKIMDTLEKRGQVTGGSGY